MFSRTWTTLSHQDHMSVELPPLQSLVVKMLSAHSATSKEATPTLRAAHHHLLLLLELEQLDKMPYKKLYLIPHLPLQEPLQELLPVLLPVLPQVLPPVLPLTIVPGDASL